MIQLQLKTTSVTPIKEAPIAYCKISSNSHSLTFPLKGPKFLKITRFKELQLIKSTFFNFPKATHIQHFNSHSSLLISFNNKFDVENPNLKSS